MKEAIIKNIETEKDENEFQFRFLRNEAVGLLTTKNEEHYLILDSLDYWFDVIQNEYPKRKICACSHDFFFIQFEYIFRQNSESVREIKITTTCSDCNKKSKPIFIDIDYAPTNNLIENPIEFCEKPNIKYKYSELTSYWNKDDLDSFLSIVFNELKLNAYCWYFKLPENVRVFEQLTMEELSKKDGRFLNVFLTKDQLDIEKMVKFFDDKGVYLIRDSWRKYEMISLSIISMYEIGPLYYINFCNQYIDKGLVVDKSKEFETITNQLMDWLNKTFITKRGTKCYDGKEAFDKFIAKNK